MGQLVARYPVIQDEDESLIHTFDFSDALGTSETIDTTGTPVVTEEEGDGLATIGTPSVNTGTIARKDGTTIAVQNAIQVRISTISDGVRYRFSAKHTTSASNTIKGHIWVI